MQQRAASPNTSFFFVCSSGDNAASAYLWFRDMLNVNTETIQIKFSLAMYRYTQKQRSHLMRAQNDFHKLFGVSRSFREHTHTHPK